VDRVIVIRNDSSAVSRAVAEDYMRKRGVHNIVSVRCRDSAAAPANETIPYAAYLEEIETPVRAFLTSQPLIDFIVLTKGIPIRIKGAPGIGSNSRPSLDSYLAALDYDKNPLAGRATFRDADCVGTAWLNRFWNSSLAFSHAKFGGYLVTRLDGFTEADARALIDRALAAEQKPRKGRILFDTNPAYDHGGFAEFNADMKRAAAALHTRRVSVRLDVKPKFVGKRADLMGYVSWGSNDRNYNASAYHSLRFVPGAVCETAVSSSGRTFLHVDGGQSLIADLIAQGATGAKGYTEEPKLSAIATPTILFDRYTRGWTLAESFYAASRYVGWEDIVLGDPLCRPYGFKAFVDSVATRPSSAR
jgi:uncharacterized protein (TIGR03790 family)